MTIRRATKILNLHRCVARTVVYLFILQRCRAQDVNSNEVVPARNPPAVVKVASQTPSRGSNATTTTTAARASPRVVVCPLDTPNALARILSVNCERNADCNFLGANQRCCKKICRRGVDAPLNEPPHEDVLGFRRKCPVHGFAERLPVKRCAKDEDCEGVNRICCPDKKDNKLYCRTALPVWSALPFPENHDALRSLAGFLQCQSAPPTVIDIFARPCNKTMDCLPNLCCQEGSNKVCRPPIRSLLGLAAQATSVSFPSDRLLGAMSLNLGNEENRICCTTCPLSKNYMPFDTAKCSVYLVFTHFPELTRTNGETCRYFSNSNLTRSGLVLQR